MKIDSAIEEAMKGVLANAGDQSEDFKRHLKNLVTNVVTGNYLDSDLRHVMESIRVEIDPEE